MWRFIQPLLRFSYWFGTESIPFLPAVSWTILIVMGLLLVGGILLYVWAPRQLNMEKDVRAVYQRFGTIAGWAGAVGLLLWAFTWQGIPVFSMRIWFVVWFALFGWWKWKLYRYLTVDLQKAKAARAEKEAREKWLPRHKK